MSKKVDWEKQTVAENVLERIAFNPDPDRRKEVKEFFDTPIDKRIVLIQSVRGTNSNEPDYVKKFLEKSRKEGKAVYIPKIHNNQKDPYGGLLICNTMRYVIENSINTAVDYNPESEGTKFDLGIAYYFENGIELLNPQFNTTDKVYETLKQRSGINVHINTDFSKKINKSIYALALDHISPEITFRYKTKPNIDTKEHPSTLNTNTAMLFGIIFATNKSMILTNPRRVQKQIALEDKLGVTKSYSKVALQYAINTNNQITDSEFYKEIEPQ